MNPFAVQILQNAQELMDMAPEWERLWQRTPTATPFQSPGWLLSWWASFRPGELRTVAVRTAGRLVAVAPLYLERGPYGCRLLPIGISLSDYTDILIDPKYQSAGEAIAATLKEMNDFDVLEWTEVPARPNIPYIFDGTWEVHKAAGSICPIVDLSKGVEHLREVISPSRWRHLKTARNRARRRGGYSIMWSHEEDAKWFLGELVRLHALSANERGANVFADRRVAEFHLAALPQLFKLGIVRLYGLTIGDSMAAIYYGWHCCDRSYAYCSGYDPQFAFESPGTILIGHAIETAIVERDKEFDFLRGQEAYKYEWGAEDRRNSHLTAARRERLLAYA